jgi:chemotaxis protein histidine kinase CheA
VSVDNFANGAGVLAELAGIQQNFLQRARGELPLLLERLQRIQAGDATELARLQDYAHRIHGSGAVFEFAAISESAWQVENLCEQLIATSVESAVAPHNLHRLVEFGRRLALEIGAATTPGPGVCCRP